MVIIFYDAEKEELYICSNNSKMQILPIDSPDILSSIPNDDILYVEYGKLITKKQFGDWLSGSGPAEKSQTANFVPSHITSSKNNKSQNPQNPQSPITSDYSKSKWIHPAHNGTILIHDIKTAEYPGGLEMVGKYDFVAVDSLGGFEALEESIFYRTLLAKGKIKVVDYDFVKKNIGKKKQQSLADAAHDALLIKDSSHGAAESIARLGGIRADEGAGDIEFLVE